jgi:uncharacterized protein YdeI (YjbR/CyaY-like superfamily)
VQLAELRGTLIPVGLILIGRRLFVMCPTPEEPPREDRVMSARNPSVDRFMDRATRWPEEMGALRDILLDCDLTEELKWGKPCYAAAGGNIVIMQPFKQHLSLMFFKGALLKDPEGVLRSQGENTQSALRMEFTGPEQVAELEPTVRAYVAEAIAVEEAGLEAPKKDVANYEIPRELEQRFAEDPEYREAFEALTPGRRKSYLLHFADAKRAQTRERRIEQSRTKVVEGRGFHER